MVVNKLETVLDVTEKGKFTKTVEPVRALVYILLTQITVPHAEVLNRYGNNVIAARVMVCVQVATVLDGLFL